MLVVGPLMMQVQLVVPYDVMGVPLMDVFQDHFHNLEAVELILANSRLYVEDVV